MSKLIMNVGGMFSGKSSKLIEQAERSVRGKKKTIILKPSIDTRYSENEIVTHSGKKIRAISCASNNILIDEVNNSDVILIDEFQFFDCGVVEQVETLVIKGKKVYISGLDMDYLGYPFTIMTLAMGIADQVNKLHAVCHECGEDAMYSHRIDKSDLKTISLGNDDKYIPLCRKCFFNKF